MGLTINFRADYGMDLETLWAQITAWRKAGYTDEEIQEHLDELRREPKKAGDSGGDM